jgi:flagellar biosynthesis protein
MDSEDSTGRDVRRTAAAIGYDAESDSAPRLLAKGQGDLAERIIAVAKQHNIPIREDRNLVALLSQLNLNQEIPSELYRTVAEILTFIYKANERWKSQEN